MAFNSADYEYADVKVSILGRELSGLRGLTYKEAWEKKHVYGQGRKPKAISKGFLKYEGTLMILKSDFDELNLASRAAGYRNISHVPGKLINIVCVYQKEGETSFKTDSCINVEITEWEDGMKSGDSEKEVSLPFLCLDILSA